MATTITKPDVETKLGGSDSGGGGPIGFSGGGADDWGKQALPTGTQQLGMIFGLASISMLFLGLTSAYVVRRGVSGDWAVNQMPALLLVNTFILVASSLTMEKARRTLKKWQDLAGFRSWFSMTLLLGGVFLIGQVIAWRQLQVMGVYLGTNAHSSFFYTMTGLHALHLAGGVLIMGYFAVRSGLVPLPISGGEFSPARRQRWADVTAIYWHFMDGLWIYLLVLLFGLS